MCLRGSKCFLCFSLALILFDLSHSVLFLFINIIVVVVVVLDAFLYSKEKRKKRYGFGWMRKWEDQTGVGGGKTIIRILCIKYINFQFNKKESAVNIPGRLLQRVVDSPHFSVSNE